jgi:hypothetical protein
VSIALFQPPAGEGEIIDEPEALELHQGGVGGLLVGPGLEQSATNLPAAPGPRREVASGDVQAGRLVGRLAISRRSERPPRRR